MATLSPDQIKWYYFPITLDSCFERLDITEDIYISKLENEERKKLFGFEVTLDKIGSVISFRPHPNAEIKQIDFNITAPIAESSIVHANYLIKAHISFNSRSKVNNLNIALKLLRLSRSGISRGFAVSEVVYFHPESSWKKIKSFLDLKEDDKKEILEIISKLESNKNDKTKLIIDLFCHATRGEISLSDSNRFLDLITILESIFNPTDNQELRFRVSLTAAKYFEKYYAANSKDIFQEIKQLYDVRSKIIHTGKKDEITNEKLVILSEFGRKISKDYLINTERFSDSRLIDLLF